MYDSARFAGEVRRAMFWLGNPGARLHDTLGCNATPHQHTRGDRHHRGAGNTRDRDTKSAPLTGWRV